MELPGQLKRSHSNVSPVYIWPRTPIKFGHIAFVITRWPGYSATNNIWDLHILYLGQRKVVVKRPPGFPFTRSYLASHVLCTQLVVHKKYLCTMYVRNAQCTVHTQIKGKKILQDFKRPPGFPFTRSYLASHVLCAQLVAHKKWVLMQNHTLRVSTRWSTIVSTIV